MIEIIPAILPKTFDELVGHLSRIRHGARAVQVDIIDSSFAPNRTWPYADADTFERIMSEEEGMPFWEEFDFEFDVMAMHPERDVENLVHAGAARIVLHTKSTGVMRALELLQDTRGGELGVKVGLAIEISEPLSILDQYKGMYDYVQVMGIARVGYQGEAFDERALPIVAAVRAAQPEMPIQVDGGVRLKNARALVKAGATRLVVGSAVFGADDPHEALQALYTEVHAKR